MILHLTTDSRFTDYTLNLFTNERTKNHHLLGTRYPGQETRFVGQKSEIETYIFGWSNAKKLVKRIDPRVVVIHFMDVRWYEVIAQLPGHVKVVWIFWGGDGYSLPRLRTDVLDPLTLSLRKKIIDEGGASRNMISKMKAELGVKSIFNKAFFLSVLFEGIRKIRVTESTDKIRKECFNRVDYCGTFLKEDFDLLQSHYNFKMQWIDARFVSLERLIGTDFSAEPKTGNNILIGNSSTLENNHLDCFDLLSNVNLEPSQQVICPINYGKDLGKYRDKVIESGKQYFGEHFEPLTELVDLRDYNEILKSCGVAIMFHKRQQAFNNILALVYLGVKVYLRKENSIYQYLKRIGCKVFDSEELRTLDSFEYLSKEEVLTNREIITQEFSDLKILESVRGIEGLCSN